MNPHPDKSLFSFFKGKKVLVTGASGYIGSNLVEALHGLPCEIIFWTRERGDIRNLKLWKDALTGVDVVCHLAGQTSAYFANQDPTADYNLNVLPMLHLVKTCRKLKSKPIVLFAATVTQAGLTKNLPVSEIHPDQPVTFYDLHKLLAEHCLEFFTQEGVIRGASLRLSNVYGPGPAAKKSDRGVLNKMIRKALAGEPLVLYGQGDCLRDYVYIDDVCEAFLLAAANIDQIKGRHFVIGSGEGHTLEESFETIVKLAADRTGQTVAINRHQPPEPLLPIEGRNFIADSRLFSKKTGWRPAVSLEEGILRTMEELGSGFPLSARGNDTILSFLRKQESTKELT